MRSGFPTHLHHCVQNLALERHLVRYRARLSTGAQQGITGGGSVAGNGGPATEAAGNRGPMTEAAGNPVKPEPA